MNRTWSNPPFWARLLAGLITAILWTAANPNLHQDYLAWVALVPFLFAIDGLPPWRAALLGFLTGWVAWLGLIYWMIHIALIALIALTLYEAVWWLLFTRILISWKSPLQRALLGPLLWVTLEWLRSLTPLGFSWGALGLSQYRRLPLIQSASWGGVQVLSYAIVAVSFAVWFWLSRKGSTRRDYVIAGLPALMLPLLWITGFFALRGDIGGEESPPICLVQGNLEVDAKMEEDPDTILLQHIDVSAPGLDQGAELLVWPETTAVYPLTLFPEYLASIERFVMDANVDLFFGSVEAETHTIEGSTDLEDLTNYNSAYFIPRDILPATQPSFFLSLVSPPPVPANELPRYDKVLPVPYGEYVPGRQFLPFVDQVVRSRQGGAFTPGRERTIFEWRRWKFSALICFESTFAWHARAFVKDGADFLVNITNDAWFKQTSAPWQHLSHSVFRAVENHVPVIRAANSGVTCFIDARGRMESSLPLFTAGQITGTLKLGQGGTFYTRHGNVFALGCCIVLILGAAIRKSTVSSPSTQSGPSIKSTPV